MTAGKTDGGKRSPFLTVSGLGPFLLSGVATALLVGYLSTGPHPPNFVVENGVSRQDASLVARLWQVLIVLQLPLILYFAARWLPKDRTRALTVLGLQMLALVAAVLPVLYLER